ncbi:hypothetical protein MYSTI_04277 [Myxococcus stipitatus DSM 14675]|uniref:PNPLA domain-containing protein n=1 Tax=Myxococcus stipitatus (strain DSM 14675 / JCM 12634 / Mx s8) TaxID=1278073 RepID=L7UCI3_MYXSD|nr:patatin-like phospholipase family protein [Myxococcus stipitatus]AGC45575.1 hypothetical protein MYSTI_04277 [Myxococcus stipitatus DSM 14675]
MSKRRSSHKTSSKRESGKALSSAQGLLHAVGEQAPPPPPPRWVRYLEKRLTTVVALLVAFLALSQLPQVHNIVLQLPSTASLRGGGSALLAIAFSAYVILLGIFFFMSALWVFVPREDDEYPGWMRHPNRVSQGVKAICKRLVSLARFPLAEGSAGRVWLHGAIIVAAVTLGVVGWLGLLPAPWKARDPGPSIVAGLALSVGLVGLFGRRFLAWKPSLGIQVEVVTRGLVMTLGSYFLAELLWGVFIPNVPEASFRLYTIWAIYHLLFVILCVARALDLVPNVVRRTVFALAALACMFLIGEQLARQGTLTALAREEPVDAQTVFTEWMESANARLDQMCDGPVVFVSAAGGGSRAAIFAMLSLESLNRMRVDPPDTSTPRCVDQRLSEHVLFISSVSGGSVASAHFSHRLAQGTLGVPLAPGVPLKHAPREELEAHLMDGACGLKADRLWPLSSAALDDMFVDFNAPLLRGLVMPGVSRGEGLASFWSDYLTWPASFSERGRAPLLLVNTASARTGARVVTGKPPLPSLMVNDGKQPSAPARSTSELVASGDIALADAVRASANFPWIVDLPSVVDAKGNKEPLIDGGVFDNTGLDTFVLLLRGLTDSERWKAKPGAQAAIDQFFAKLERRGVLFVEIDSGAKPPSLDESSSSGGALSTPLSALSRASHAFARDMAEYQKAEIGRLLAGRKVTMLQASYDYGDVELSDDASPQQRECFAENQDEVMTAWALGPKDKGRLLGQFLWQEETVGQRIASHIKNLRGAALTEQSLLALLERGLGSSQTEPFIAKLRDPATLELAKRVTGRLASDQVALQQQATSRLYDRDAPAVQVFLDTEMQRPEREVQPDVVEKLEDGSKAAWVFLGQYLSAGSAWRTCYFCKPTDARWSQPPQQFVGRTMESTVPALLRDDPPTGQPATEGRTLGALKVGQSVTVLEVQDWNNLGFIWAKVTLAPREKAKH